MNRRFDYAYEVTKDEKIQVDVRREKVNTDPRVALDGNILAPQQLPVANAEVEIDCTSTRGEENSTFQSA